jgi:hypothetical protein
MAQAAVGQHAKVRDAVMQTVGDIQLFAIGAQRQPGGKLVPLYSCGSAETVLPSRNSPLCLSR